MTLVESRYDATLAYQERFGVRPPRVYGGEVPPSLAPAPDPVTPDPAPIDLRTWPAVRLVEHDALTLEPLTPAQRELVRSAALNACAHSPDAAAAADLLAVLGLTERITP